MNNIYLISGLGADERVFKNLKFYSNKPKVIHWIKNKKNENLKEYCLRLSDQIRNKKKLILIGVSFGGIVAIELSKILKTEKVVIISSIKLASEKPIMYNLAKKLRILNFIPSKIFNLHSFIIDFLFDVNSSEEQKLIREFIKNNEPEFIKWSLNEILKWGNKEIPSNLIHIHGEKDKLFPLKKIHNPIPIKDGGHFMILNKHDEISSILNKYNII
ncbi:alpha/beta hydrolase [Leptospira sp. 2 VSF19]|uniref:Alpha/beta hydrolase n=1 Tax=Leptospira soteropolitanensis TaxID=2950025 RepID=A0AAW5VQG8_9LEPT|nr:alpha/beta hydrolase [Leptospira soteropolitanensis]MCW7494791.1 alpha/beta hydrolase [Leptospira soteropolitanensis]MCW7502383.1 alpha/beta hydrolase [Leptospira soteropolitanensis]MCW7524618.1 alpha/beta hydrolase [Leptospira soteropolitanensis]MCW7528485.1 alpha/beta hydrolase [Leptospira soteropolitanensis]MCW7532350.1 alpha/beta hydrolase [Leptospira soteropolitanensis]